MVKIAINGFGRVGKNFLRAILKDKVALEKLDVTVINIGKGEIETIDLAFKYDSVLGTYSGPEEVSFQDDSLIIGSKKIKIIAQTDPLKINWKQFGIDWVVDASGKFTKREDAQKHINSGAKKVLITAPAHGEDVTIIPGVNYSDYKDSFKIISLGSCTTNALAPMLKVLVNNFEIEHVAMTTVHAYTNSQALLDSLPNKNHIRRARAAAINIVPSTTGATEVIGKIIPQVKGKAVGCSLRVPVAKVSIVDLVVTVNRQNISDISASKINKLYENAAESDLKNILEFCKEPLVSCDFAGNPSSVIIDSLMTQTTGNTIKLMGWYDNEWGYSSRLKDFLLYTLL